MKSFVAIIPILAFATMGVAHGGSDYHAMKEWMKGKAMASCMGEENVKYWETEMKKHEAECAGEEAPELELPFFKSPYRVTSGLIGSAYANNNEFADEMIKKFMFKKMMRSMMRHGKFDDEDMPFLKKSGAYHRYRRQAAEGETDSEIETKPATPIETKPATPPADSESTEVDLDLGDKLLEKLESYKEKMQAEIGNMTCALRKCGIVNENNEIQLENMIAHFDKLPVPLNPWLKEHLIADKRKCYAYAQALPEEILNDCVTGPQITKIKFFKKCLKMAKAHTCMNYDVRQNLEANFGSVEELVEKTGMEEKELYALVSAIMNDDHHH
ncbi:uncharacterized protein LOC131879386 [Tigriopus californicus]|nr:uncharacterized protein LOC131879386 [Tigriopus californicus]